jgi:hypothetical protein
LQILRQSEAALLAGVQAGPVSVAVEASQSVFQFYKSGIIDSAACGTSVDHAVLVVGYGTNFWKMKNS